jgi:hypothetical protein
MTMGSPAVTITDGVAVEVRPHPGWGVSDDCFKGSTCLGVKLGSERCIPTELDSDATEPGTPSRWVAQQPRPHRD